MPLYKDDQNKAWQFSDQQVRHRQVPSHLTPITQEEADAIIEASKPTPTADSVRAQRDAKIEAVAWRYERHARQVRLGMFVQDDLAALDIYVQALADVPEQSGFPTDVEWPVEPVELVEGEV